MNKYIQIFKYHFRFIIINLNYDPLLFLTNDKFFKKIMLLFGLNV